MTVTLTALIEQVEARSESAEPLALLATASATVEEVSDITDALLSHFVDRSRRAGHSWTEIGASLGVTKQAVQKRFTGERRNPRGWERFTKATRLLVTDHAEAVATELGHNYVGTEHLLAAMWGQPKAKVAKALAAAGLTRAEVITAIEARVPRGHTSGRGGYTPRAWVAIENAARIASDTGDDEVRPEHVLLSLMNGVGGIAEEILLAYRASSRKLAGLVAPSPAGTSTSGRRTSARSAR